jgi:hypothetical protein
MTFHHLTKLLFIRIKTSQKGLIFIGIFCLTACQTYLWGAPPPLPTITGTPTQNSASAINLAPVEMPTLALAYTPMSSTKVAAPIGMEASRVWASPATPLTLQEKFHNLGFQMQAPDKVSASLYIDVVRDPTDTIRVSTWTYALVAPFPTLVDDVASQELLASWNGSAFGPYTGIPLLMEESTLETFTALWGPPVNGAVQVASSDKLLDTAWNNMPAWAIIPFEQIEPKWKVLTIDGQSPVQKKFDQVVYPLTVNYRLMCVEPCQIPNEMNLSFQNRDPNKLATVILTGVTAMVRATAKTMNAKGILYPGEEIRDLLREADITHINNEVPFFTGCPDPDPNQRDQVFCSDPRYIELLVDVGTDVIELSGDHFADYKVDAMYETLDIYKQYDLPYYGGGYNVSDGRKPLLLEVNGNKIMFIGCNYKTIYASARETVPGSVVCDFDYMTGQIEYYRSQGYMPISTFQYHEFDSIDARPQQMVDFRRMANSGALIVSGSQAHVPQVMEFYSGAFIHYGLGNLFFDQISDKGPHLTENEFIDRHIFYDGRYLGVELLTMRLIDYSRPRFMTAPERDKMLEMYFIGSGWDFPQVKR